MNPIGAIAILATSGLAGLSCPQAPGGPAPAGHDPSTFTHYRLARDVGASRTDRPASVPRGYIIMIHSTFEPHGNQQSEQLSRRNSPFDQLITGTEYALGSGGATRDGDYIVFHAISYAADTVRPVTLHFMEANRPQQRVHNDLAHFMLHMAILGAPVDLRAIDATTSVASPLVVDSAVDTRSSGPSHHRLQPHV
jgi:hypothetical protein